MSDATTAAERAELVGGRYQLLNLLGQGGMGSTHRALDRLSGRVVTLKRLNVAEVVTVIERLSRSESRLALAQEFHLLASLRHPNIISVLDYGFDDARRPFFCMDLQENAQTIVDAGRDKPLLVRADLLVQLLRAMVYLHRHGIIHRDIKPENVVVAGAQVKVLDFGLSVYRDLLGQEGVPLAGTLAYMAPELLRGERPSERSDLYAVGVLAYELFSGRVLASSAADEARMIASGQGAAWLLRRPGGDLDPRLRPVVDRLLAGDAGDRYADAGEAIDALAAALGQPFNAETVATRESFLQAAPFVGREHELELLNERLRAAAEGRGGTLLIGGESGVGKSRLMEEVRARGLVSGCVVTGGQAVSEGGSPYHLWRDVVSELVVRGDVGDQAAGVLRTIAPEIARLLGRPVPDPPVVDPAAAQSRLLLVVEGLVRAQTLPVLILLEDLQWAGTESLALLAALARLATDRALLIVCSFRSDEASELPARVEAAAVMQLPRLDREGTAKLAQMMIGSAGMRPEVAALLERETEGIPLFIVEAMRSLAESVGSLADIGSRPLPQHLLSGGMRKVLQRRVEHLPREALPALRTAAVAGREIDPALLRLVHPGLDCDWWLRSCAEAAIVELQEQGGRFAHDKLREHVLSELSPEERAALNRKVAEAIERAYPNAPERDAALAHHWRLAGDPARELHYQERSAAQALAGGAYQEAIAQFERALELLDDGEGDAGAAPIDAPPRLARLVNPLARARPNGARVRRGILEAGLTEAYYRLGDLRGCEQHAAQALTTFGIGPPSGGAGWGRATVNEAMARIAQAVAGRRAAVTADPAVVEAIGRVQALLIEVYFYSMRSLPIIWSTLRHLNLTAPAGPSPDLSRAYVYLAVVTGMASMPRLAARWSKHAIEIAEGASAPGTVAYALNRAIAVELAHCWWREAAEHIHRSDAIASEIGDMRLCEEARTQAGLLALYHGPLEPGLASLRSAFELSRRSGSKQGACWSLLGEGDLLVRLGRAAEALPLFEEAMGRLDEQAMRTEAIWASGGLALAALRLDQPDRALEHARRALGYLTARAPVAFWTQQGTAGATEVLLTLLERCGADDRGRRKLAGDAALACGAMRRYARRFPLGRGHALLWRGLLEWLSGRRGRGMKTWRSAIATAQALGLPYEQARAHFEIGRHLPPSDATRAAHLDSAEALFEQLGCLDGPDWVDAERASRSEQRRRT